MSRSVPARCGSESCVVVLELRDELGRRQIADARMRANLVEVLAPGLILAAAGSSTAADPAIPTTHPVAGLAPGQQCHAKALQ